MHKPFPVIRKLSDVLAGEVLTIRELRASAETCQRLRELGFREDTLVRVIVNNDFQIICEVRNTRIGLHRSTAGEILVSRGSPSRHAG